MSITWAYPPTASPFGPGFLVSVTSDFVGPLPSDSGWTISIYDHTNEVFLMADPRAATVSKTFVHTLGVSPPTSWGVNPVYGDTIQGNTVTIRVELSSISTGVIDSATRQVTWDPISGLPYLLTLLNSRLTNLVSGNADIVQMSADIADVKVASFAEFGSPSQLIPVSSLLTHPPIGFLRRQLIGDFSGEGVIDNPGGVDRLNRFGIAWEVLAAGAYLGINEGAPDTFDLPLFDLQTVHLLADGNSEDSNRVSINFGDSMWLFEPMLPSSVRYWIQPSVELRLYWLVIVT